MIFPPRPAERRASPPPRTSGAEVLHEVSFRVQQGDYLGIVGPNGSGKSTLIKAVLGLVETDRGSVTIFDSRGPSPASRS